MLIDVINKGFAPSAVVFFRFDEFASSPKRKIIELCVRFFQMEQLNAWLWAKSRE